MLLFFEFSSGEIILILLVMFVVLGPKRLPEVARTMGKTINEMKRASAGFKNEINKEVQRLDREARLSDFLQQRATDAEVKPTNGETISTKTKNTSIPELQQTSIAEEPEDANPSPEDETGRVERRI